MSLWSGLLRRIRGTQPPEHTISQDTIETKHVDGRVDRVSWRDLTMVAVRTKPKGVVEMSRTIIVADASGNQVEVPLEFAEITGALDRFRRLPGFDARKLAVGRAIEHADHLVLWRRAT